MNTARPLQSRAIEARDNLQDPDNSSSSRPTIIPDLDALLPILFGQGDSFTEGCDVDLYIENWTRPLICRMQKSATLLCSYGKS